MQDSGAVLRVIDGKGALGREFLAIDHDGHSCFDGRHRGGVSEKRDVERGENGGREGEGERAEKGPYFVLVVGVGERGEGEATP